MKCQLCPSSSEVSVYINGKYYPSLCKACAEKLKGDSRFSSGVQSFERRRQYEDFAQDTVQPWDAMGKPNPEFYRLYPESAKKQYNAKDLEDVKRML